MNQEELKELLMKQWGSAEELRKEYKGISHLISGSFSEEKFNVYELQEGIVVSRSIDQGKEINPTIGIISPGSYHFETKGNIETMIVLKGTLNASVNEGHKSILNIYGSIIAPAETTLHLIATNVVFYLCLYTKKE